MSKIGTPKPLVYGTIGAGGRDRLITVREAERVVGPVRLRPESAAHLAALQAVLAEAAAADDAARVDLDELLLEVQTLKGRVSELRAELVRRARAA